MKKYYVESIDKNIDGLITNIKNADVNVPVNPSNILNSQYSRIYMNKKKLEGLAAKN
jgi:hypothetical protein